nr:hypothetical protein [uncultured Campylobacter sp.]
MKYQISHFKGTGLGASNLKTYPNLNPSKFSSQIYSNLSPFKAEPKF